MRRGDEDDAAHIGYWLDEDGSRTVLVAPARGSIWSSGLLAMAFHTRSPVSTTMALVRRPPWLWPMTTISDNAGSDTCRV